MKPFMIVPSVESAVFSEMICDQLDKGWSLYTPSIIPMDVNEMPEMASAVHSSAQESDMSHCSPRRNLTLALEIRGLEAYLVLRRDLKPSLVDMMQPVAYGVWSRRLSRRGSGKDKNVFWTRGPEQVQGFYIFLQQIRHDTLSLLSGGSELGATTSPLLKTAGVEIQSSATNATSENGIHLINA
jgi:hypothetical protein